MLVKDKPDIEQLKREVPILPLAGAMGIELKKLGSGEYAGLCPFHKDKNPSLHINIHKNLFHCKGCGKAGSVIDWIMLTQKLDTAGAIEVLRDSSRSLDRTHLELKKFEVEAKKKIDIKEPQYQKALNLVVDYYHQNIKIKKEGADYLLKRGLIYGELVDDFKIGYSDGSLIGAINDEEVLSSLEDLGLVQVKDATLKECFIGRVVIPVIDNEGFILQLYGRNTLNKGSKHLYLKAPLIGIFNEKSLISSNVILAESFIDALSLLALGHPNVCSSYGVNGFSDEALRLFSESKVQKVYIAYDADDPGNSAALKLSEKLIEKKIESFRIQFERGFDANSFLRKESDHDEAKSRFKELLENARPLNQLTDTAGAYESGRFESLEKKKPNHKEYHYRSGKRDYVIRGLDQNKTNSQLKIFLRLDYEADPPGSGTKFHIDNNLDLFNAKGTGSFVKAASTRLTLDERVIRADIDSLTQKLDEILQHIIEEKENKNKTTKKEYHQNLALSQKAKEFLYDPLFICRFVKEMERAGVVGESLNMFFGYVSMLSRHMSNQLHLNIQSESSSGKSNMLNLLSKLVPEEDMVYFTQVTPRSFYYGQPGFLKNKCVFIAEADGLRDAEFPIKQMMSEGRLSISYTKTDPQSGEHTAETRETEGPAQFNLTEPTEGLNEEIINRCATMILDMSLEQTERIMEFQRLLHSPEGVLLKKNRETICDFYRHIQREIKPYPVLNQHSKHLSFNAKSHQARRDHQKYLTLLNCITLLNQHQREVVMRDGDLCVQTHVVDIALANFISRRIFARSLDDLAIQTRNFVTKLVEYFIGYAKEKQIDFDQIWFYRKDMREITALSNTRVHEHAGRLVDFEYLTTRRDQNGIAYRFLFEPEGENANLINMLKLVRINDLLKKTSKKERQDYKDFLPYLKQIFKALDPEFKEEEL